MALDLAAGLPNAHALAAADNAAADDGQGIVDAIDLPTGLPRTAIAAGLVEAASASVAARDPQRSHRVRRQRWRHAEALV
jgi:hypothetical protein